MASPSVSPGDTRAQTAARERREWQAASRPKAQAPDILDTQELRAILDEEIATLPEKYRAPIILHHLESKSLDQAAHELGCLKTTLAKRVERARELLRKKLERRGITLAVASLATTLTEMTAAPLPATLTISTVKAATLVVAGKAVAGGVLSAHVLALMNEALRGMVWVKAKMVLAVAAIGLAAGAAGWTGYGAWSATGARGSSVAAQTTKPKQSPDILAAEKKGGAKDQYGDPLPPGAVARLGARRFRHDGNPQNLVFTPDGKTLIGRTYSGVLLWDVTSGQVRCQLPVRTALSANGMDVSPDGKTLAVTECAQGDEDTKVGLWELPSGKKKNTISLPKSEGPDGNLKPPVNPLRFTPDGKSLIFCQTSDGKAVIFDLVLGRVRSKLGGSDFPFDHFAISPDGKTFAGVAKPDKNGSNLGVQLWDIQTGKHIRTIVDYPDGSNGATIAFAPDGLTIALAIKSRIYIADVQTGKQLRHIDTENKGGLRGMIFSRDGKNLVSSTGESKVVVRNVGSGQAIHTFEGREGLPQSLALSPDGNTIALGTVGHSVQLWDVVSGKELFTEYIGHDFPVECLAFAVNGRTLASGSESSGIYVADSAYISTQRGKNDQILLWDMTNRKQTKTLPWRSHFLSFSPDGQNLALITSRFGPAIAIWNEKAGKKSIDYDLSGIAVDRMIFSNDAKKLILLSRNYDGQQWRVCRRDLDLDTGKKIQEWDIPPELYSPFLLPDHKTVIGAMQGGGILLFDTLSGKLESFRGEGKDAYSSILPSPNSKQVAGVIGSGAPRWGATDEIAVVNVSTGKESFRLKAHQGEVSAIAWSPDSRLMASGDKRILPLEPTGGQTVRVWNPATGKEIACFGEFNTDVFSLVFSPDGNSLVGGLRDGTILIWDVSKHLKILPVQKLGEEDLQACWADLINGDVETVRQVHWTLVNGKKQSVPFMRGKLKPVALADQGKIQKWIADLNSETFTIRQAAARELEKVGDQIQVPIQKALKEGPSLETRRRLEQILKTLPDVLGSETVRTIRAIMALERIGSPEAKAVLEALSQGVPGRARPKMPKHR